MRWRIGEFEFDSVDKVVYRSRSNSAHARRKLSDSQAKILRLLIEKRDEEYDQETFVRWAGTTNVYRAITDLRRALRDENESYITKRPHRLVPRPTLLDQHHEIALHGSSFKKIEDAGLAESIQSEGKMSRQNAVRGIREDSELRPESRFLPSDLGDHIDALQLAQPYPMRTPQSFEAPGEWVQITFDNQRDLKPALMGMPLGPADAAACPRFVEVAPLVAQIRSAYSARLVGESGTGKSICAYQVALEFMKAGWEVYRLRDSSTDQLDLRSFPRDSYSFLLIDDAHLMAEALLKRLEEEANSCIVILSVHTESDLFARARGAISIDARRAVNTIADAFIADLPKVGELIRTIDDETGYDDLDRGMIEFRIRNAKGKAQFPWQFCFMLSGGAQRARLAADSARSAGADIILACAAISQIASDDAPLSKSLIMGYLPPACGDSDTFDKAISWLVSQRLLISSRDLRCPHLRFAIVLFEEILRGQDRHQRSLVASVCESVLGNGSYPFRGMCNMVFLIRDGGAVRGEWKSLLSPQSLMALGERCWKAETPNEVCWAARTLVEVESFIPDSFGPELRNHIPVLASWISNPAEPIGGGLVDLLEHLKNAQGKIYKEALLAADPVVLASVISRVKPNHTMGLGFLLREIADANLTHATNSRFREWKTSFMSAIDRPRLIELAANWPSSERLSDYFSFCSAIGDWDDCLFMDLVEQSLPRVIHDIHEKPFHTFDNLQPCLERILKTPDLIFNLRHSLRGERRRSEIVRRICRGVEVKNLVACTSRIRRAELSDLLMLFSLLQSFERRKFMRIYEAMDWNHIEDLIRDDWENLPQDVEILLSYERLTDAVRQTITGLIERNMNRTHLFPPRLAIAFPAQAARHIEIGGGIRFRRQELDDWYFWPDAIMSLAQRRPELVMDLILKREEEIGLALSSSEWNWYAYTAWFVLNLAHWNPDCLQRVLSYVCVSTAGRGWTASLKKGGSSRKAVSLLIEAAKDRPDSVGRLARELRIQFPKSSLASWAHETS